MWWKSIRRYLFAMLTLRWGGNNISYIGIFGVMLLLVACLLLTYVSFWLHGRCCMNCKTATYCRALFIWLQIYQLTHYFPGKPGKSYRWHLVSAAKWQIHPSCTERLSSAASACVYPLPYVSLACINMERWDSLMSPVPPLRVLKQQESCCV